MKEKEIAELRDALEESVKLQSHYAILLNGYDGGKRLIFKDSNEWIARLRKLKKMEARELKKMEGRRK